MKRKEVNQNGKKLFTLKALYKKNKGFVVYVSLSKEIRTFLFNGLNNNGEIRTSENWKNENGQNQKFFYGGFNLTQMFNRLNEDFNGSFINVVDAFGNGEINNNLAILRSEELLKSGKTTYIFDGALFCDIRNLLKNTGDFLIKTNKEINGGLIEIKGFEKASKLSEKEILKEVI